TGVAYLMNTAAVRALSTNKVWAGVSAAAPDVSNTCTLDAHGALYAGWDWWFPAGKSAFCRDETYPGEPGRKDINEPPTRIGPLRATITSGAPTDIRIDLSCLTGTRHAADANYVSPEEARQLYDLVCT